MRYFPWIGWTAVAAAATALGCSSDDNGYECPDPYFSAGVSPDIAAQTKAVSASGGCSVICYADTDAPRCDYVYVTSPEAAVCVVRFDLLDGTSLAAEVEFKRGTTPPCTDIYPVLVTPLYDIDGGLEGGEGGVHDGGVDGAILDGSHDGATTDGSRDAGVADAPEVDASDAGVDAPAPPSEAGPDADAGAPAMDAGTPDAAEDVSVEAASSPDAAGD